MQKIAIIGAGLSGILCAFYLSPRAHVSVFEKSRGLGGRLSRTTVEGVSCNLGSPTITYHPIWPCDVPISSQPINACLHHLIEASQAQMFFQTQVATLLQEPSRPHVSLFDHAGLFLGTFDWVIITTPLPQTRLLCPHLPLLHRDYQSILTVFLCEPLVPHACQYAPNVFRVDLPSLQMPPEWTPWLLKQHRWQYAYPHPVSTPPAQTIFEKERIAVVGDGTSPSPGTLGALESVASWLKVYNAL